MSYHLFIPVVCVFYYRIFHQILRPLVGVDMLHSICKINEGSPRSACHVISHMHTPLNYGRMILIMEMKYNSRKEKCLLADKFYGINHPL